MLDIPTRGYHQTAILRIKPWNYKEMAYLSICYPQTTTQHLSNAILSYAIMGQSFGIVMSLLAVGDDTRELLGSITLLQRSPGL